MSSTPLARAIALAALGASIAVPSLAQAEFLKDSKATLGLRNFYYDNDNHEPFVPSLTTPTRPGGYDQREWAQAFRFDYISGFTEGTVGFGLDVTGTLGLKLDGGRGHHPDNNSFMPSDSDGGGKDDWSHAGANAKLRLSKTELRAGNALQPMLPVVLTNDSRVMSQLYDGGMLTSKEFDNLTLNAGQLGHVIGRASDNWSSLSVAGGTRGSNQFRFAGGDWKVNKELTLQYYYANLENYYKQHFAGLTHVYPISDNQSFKTDLRYFKSSDDGKNGEPGYAFNNNGGYAKNSGEVDNTTWSAMFTYSLGGHAIMLGHQRVSDDGGFVWLNQGNVTNGDGRNEGNGGSDFYLFTNSVVGSFVRAGENTTFGQYSYDFSKVGIPGLKASVSYLSGDDITPTSGVGKDLKEWERDERIDYVFQEGALKGFGVTLRHGTYRSEGVSGLNDTDQTRLILNYTLQLM
ncbi:OprD family porin [Pseudomonas kuykendallii]|uniref:Outer membrane porin, OprD family n=1 Tax=Pseudomonas kuykendallii TaxID=1007099 RepID=A0A2W5ERZ4_9PSED|nr:OprD family porin [Pseudomonas kuykendallii]PZP22826.1 MAG: outer membrane porin, OprD family [Pseudomonas kuykendallii]